MIKAFIFDADGTIFDSLSVWRKADTVYLKSLGKELTDEAFDAFSKLTFAESIEYVKQYYKLDLSCITITEQILKTVRRFYQTEVGLMPGINELLKAIKAKGLQAVIATANDKTLVCDALKANGIEDYFTAVLCCDELDTNKNSPDIFLYAAEIMKTKPNETAVFEDDITAYEVAKKAGFTVFHAHDAEGFVI